MRVSAPVGGTKAGDASKLTLPAENALEQPPPGLQRVRFCAAALAGPPARASCLLPLRVCLARAPSVSNALLASVMTRPLDGDSCYPHCGEGQEARGMRSMPRRGTAGKEGGRGWRRGGGRDCRLVFCEKNVRELEVGFCPLADRNWHGVTEKHWRGRSCWLVLPAHVIAGVRGGREIQLAVDGIGMISCGEHQPGLRTDYVKRCAGVIAKWKEAGDEARARMLMRTHAPRPGTNNFTAHAAMMLGDMDTGERSPKCSAQRHPLPSSSPDTTSCLILTYSVAGLVRRPASRSHALDGSV